MPNEFDIGSAAGDVLPPAPAPSEQQVAPAAQPGRFDDDIRAMVQIDNRSSAASRAMAHGIQQNPDEYARYVRLSQKTGLDPELLMEDSDVRSTVEHRMKLGSIDFDSLVKTNPFTASFISDPHNAAVAQDDIENLSALEIAWRFASRPIRAIAAGVPSAGAAMYGVAASPFGVIGSLADKVGNRDRSQAAYDIERFFLNLQKRSEGGAAWVRGDQSGAGFVEKSMLEGFESFGQTLTTLPLALATGNPQLALLPMAAQTGGSSYGKARAKGVSPLTSAGYGISDAVVEYATEKLPVKYLLNNDAFRKSLVRAFINYQIREGGTEQIATILQDLNEWAVLNPDKPFSWYLAQRPSQALRTAIATTAAGSGHVAIQRTMDHIINGAQLKQDKAFFDALSKGVTESKLAQRLPEKMREYIAKLKEADGSPQDVYVRADKFNEYFQSKGIDPVNAAVEILGQDGLKQHQEATALNADIVIPVEAYAEKVAGTEHHQGLAQDIRLRQGDMSEREYQLAEANITADEKRLRDMVDAANAQVASDEPAQRVYQELYGELVAASVTPSQAAALASLEAARYRVRASRIEGTDAYSLWRENGGISVRRPMPEAISKYRGAEPVVDSLLNALREGKIPQKPAEGQLNYADMTLKSQLEELAGALDELGINVNTLTNEQVRNQLFRPEEVNAGGRAYAAFNQLVMGREVDVQDFIKAGLVSESGLTGPQRMFRATRQGQSTELTPGAWVTDDKDMALTVYAPGESGNAHGTVTEHTIPGEHLVKVHPGGYIYAPPGTDISDVLRHRDESGRAVTFGELLNRTLYQSAPLWYSALHRSVEAVKTQKAPAAQWLDIIRGLKGVKKEEITWSGVEEWLQLRGKQSTTRAEVLQYLDQNGVRVEETFNLGHNVNVDGYPDWWVWNQAHENALDIMRGRYPDVDFDQHFEEGELLDEFRLLQDEEARAIAEEEDLTTTGEYSEYQLPGGKDYKELLLTLPVETDASRAKEFRSSHFPDQPNVLAHMRFNSRIDADGKRVLFLEELQSDWAQKGREKGFSNPRVVQKDNGKWTITDDSGIISNSEWFNRESAEDAARDWRGVPSAPFVTDTKAWVGLVLKRMIRYAAENGFDRVAWTTGEQQNARWDLAQHIDMIVIGDDPDNEGMLEMTVWNRGRNEPYSRTTSFESLPDEIGKELAAEIERRHESGENPVEFDFKKEGGRLVGGEGMKAFYDSIVPQVANDLLRRLGGEKVKEIPVIGEMAGRDRTPHDEVGIQPGFDITSDLRANALSGMPLFQKKRGSVTLGENYRLIQLLEDADLSTFLHELGHTWLEELQRDAKREGASESVRADWEVVRGWLGVGPDEAIPVDAHEKWARGTEMYFAEGRSPAVALREIFHKFKAWVMSVYQDLTQLDVTLTDEVRAVMDRLLATDQEIEDARLFQSYTQMFSTPEQAGMTEAEFKAYATATAAARIDAQDKLTQRVMRELRRENERWWKEEEKRVREVVRREAEAMPVYQAVWALTHDKFIDGSEPEQRIKLSRDGLVAMYGEAYLKELSPQRLKTSGWVYAVEGGLHPDTVASIFGLTSGDELIKAITSAPPMREWIDAEVKQRMFELHGDMMRDGTIAAEAVDALHNDRQADVLATELRVLRRKQREVEPILKAIVAEQRAEQRRARDILEGTVPQAILRDIARQEIGSKRIGSISPVYYSRAEAAAGKEAFEAASKGKYAEAADAKQRQILNYFFYRESVRARNDVERIERLTRRLSKDRARARIGKAGQEWLEQLDAILERYSFAPMSHTMKARSIMEWARSVEQATGESLAIAPEVLDESIMTNYREMTLDRLRAVGDTIESIVHVARKINQVIRNGQKFEKAEMIKELVAAAEKNLPVGKPLPETEKVYGQVESVWEKTKGFLATNLRPEKVIERLDGGKSGIWHDLFWNPAVDAQTKRDDLRMMVMKPLTELQRSMSKERQIRMNQDVFLPKLGRKLTRRTLIGVALNVGNASNKDKLQRGGMWFGESFMPISDEQLDEMLTQLDAEDWRMVQTIWDSIAQLYPYLDDLNRRAVGLPLEKVEPMPVVTKYGTFAGGYWPAVADPRHSKVGERQENAEAMATELFAPRYPKAATMHSFREARTEAAYPIQFDWERVLSNHVDKAITDIAYHEWVKQSRRLLENQSIKKVMQNRLGESVYRSMEEWLVHQVRPIHGGYMANRDIDSLGNTLISNTVVAALGFKVATAFGNLVVAPVQASHQVRPDYIIRGITKFLSSPAKAIESVHMLSGEMRHRAEHLDQTFNIVVSQLEGKRTIREQIGYWAMQIHRVVDLWTSTSLWLGKYQQEIDHGATPEDAMRLADKMIRTTQTAGAPKDLSSFERDPRFRMFKLFIGPMIIMQNEMRGAVAGKGIKSLTSPAVWGTMFATWILPAMLFELAVGRGPEDDEEWWQWAIRKILLYPALTLPFVRDAANAAEQHIIGKEANVRSNPFTDVLLALERAMRTALSENAEIGDKIRAAARAGGTMIGLPVGQINTSAVFIGDVLTDEYDMEGPQDIRYLFYKRKE